MTPGDSAEIELDLTGVDRRPGYEYHLMLAARSKEAEPLVPAGHLIAWEQFELETPGTAATGRLPQSQTLELLESDSRIIVRSADSEVAFSRDTGSLETYRVQRQDLILRGPRPNFWRPPTDNDLGNSMHEWAAIWKEVSEQAELVLIRARRSEVSEVMVEAEYHLPPVEGRFRTVYRVRGDGSIHVQQFLTLPATDLPKMPRIGTQLVLPAQFDQVTWLGRGPHESYADRKSSAPVGRYTGRVDEQFHRYSRPQETGNKTDVRWMAVTDANGVGLLAVGDELLSASVWPFAMGELDFVPGAQGAESASGLVPVTSRHGADLEIDDFVTWNLDLAQMGVGGDTSWGRLVHEEYTIPPGDYSYGFTLIPLEAGSDAAATARAARARDGD